MDTKNQILQRGPLIGKHLQINIRDENDYACLLPTSSEIESMKFLPVNLDNIIVHISLSINPCACDNKIKWMRKILLKECLRAEAYGLKYLVFHPGTCQHSKVSEVNTKATSTELNKLLKRCADTINYVHKNTKSCVLLIENMAGQGNQVGYKLSHLKNIIDLTKNKDRVGICIDTCHAFASGYKITTDIGYNTLIGEILDLDLHKYLKLFHLNDSKDPCGSLRDRHQLIGKGHIGLRFFWKLMNDEIFNNIPAVIETGDSNDYMTLFNLKVISETEVSSWQKKLGDLNISNYTKKHLYSLASASKIKGRSKLSKEQLFDKLKALNLI